MPIGKEHSPVKLIEIRRSYGRLHSRARDAEYPICERLSLHNEIGGLVRLPLAKELTCLPVQFHQFLDRFCVPRLFCGIGFWRLHRRGRRMAPYQERCGQKGDETHDFSINRSYPYRSTKSTILANDITVRNTAIAATPRHTFSTVPPKALGVPVM